MHATLRAADTPARRGGDQFAAGDRSRPMTPSTELPRARALSLRGDIRP
jgi:hypothetical protein